MANIHQRMKLNSKKSQIQGQAYEELIREKTWCKKSRWMILLSKKESQSVIANLNNRIAVGFKM